MEKLRVAIRYGADAVYLGGKAFGLRNMAGNFDIEELREAVDYSHNHGVRVFLTVNSFLNNDDLPGFQRYLEEIKDIPVDAYIAADPGVIAIIREVSPEKEIHLSTQANTTNWKTVEFWRNQGVQRVNLARELSLEEITEVRKRTTAELEVFVHGAMCISYSGRCLLSSVMTGRNANKGECTHPCRWGYSLVEETRPGEYFPIVEENNTTFIFNSKDLCLIENIPALVEAGVDSLKIEGRMKGIYYAASVTRIYREAIDRYCADPAGYRFDPAWLGELAKISHRGYTTGFFHGQPRDVDHEYNCSYLRSYDFVAIVEEAGIGGVTRLGVRNRISVGDQVEVIGPRMKTEAFVIEKMTTLEGTEIQAANPNQQVLISIPGTVGAYDLIRREKRE